MRHENILAPLYSEAFRWFREEHDLIHIIVRVGTIEDFIWMATIDNKRWIYKGDTYEKAELACLKKLIEIVKENKDE